MKVLHREINDNYAMALVQGENELEYTVLIDATDFDACSCGCPDHFYRQHICKHMDYFLDYLSLVYPSKWMGHRQKLMEEDRCRKEQMKELASSPEKEFQAPLNP